MLRTLSRLFTLKPYGNQLVNGVTETWLLLAAVNILSIAFCDAVAWAYFGYTTAHGYAAYATLDPREKASGAAMSPVRFADWYENDQQVRDMTERLRDQTASAVERLKVREDAVRVLHETLREDIGKMHEEVAAASKASDDLELQVESCRRELEPLTAKIAEQQQALDDFQYDFSAELPLADQQLLLASRSRTARSLAENRAVAATLSASLDRLTRRLEASRQYESQLRASLSASDREVTDLTRALQEARQRGLAEILG